MRNLQKHERWSRLAQAMAFCVLSCLSLRGATITGFSPTFGPPGTVVTITGTGLQGTTNVLLNQTNYADFTNVSSLQLQTVVPVGAASGSFTVVGGGSSATSSGTFTVGPIITSFSPGAGANPTAVTIYGANFVTGATAVTFTGAAATNGTVTAQDQVVAVVPANAMNGPITVTTVGGSAVTTSNFIVSSGPTITDFSPTAGPAGTSVVIDGSNFLTNGTTVFFGTVQATTGVDVVASTEVTATVPAGATNSHIIVTTAHGSYTSSNIFVTGFSSQITDFNPTFGPAGTIVTIDGTGFSTSKGLTFAGVRVPQSSFTVSNDTEFEFPVPVGASNGPISIASSLGAFTTSTNFLSSSGPVIMSFSPTEGAVGSSVTLNGFNLSEVTSVKFGSKSVTTVQASQDTQLPVIVPAGATNAPIQATSSTGTFITTNSFIVSGAGPIITGFSPSNGVQGMPVTITGEFSTLGNPGVEFAGAVAAYSLTSYNQVTATVPSNAVTGAITLLNSGGSTASTGLFYLQPWVTNFTPTSGNVNSTVTIGGRNLTGATSVTFNGVLWSFTGNSTQLVATVPANATSGQLVVTTPGGIFIDTNVFIAGSLQETLNVTLLTNLPAVLLSWSNVGVSFTLESSTNLSSPSFWRTNTSPQITVGNRIFVTNTNTGPDTYFELKAQ